MPVGDDVVELFIFYHVRSNTSNLKGGHSFSEYNRARQTGLLQESQNTGCVDASLSLRHPKDFCLAAAASAFPRPLLPKAQTAKHSPNPLRNNLFHAAPGITTQCAGRWFTAKYWRVDVRLQVGQVPRCREAQVQPIARSRRTDEEQQNTPVIGIVNRMPREANAVGSMRYLNTDQNNDGNLVGGVRSEKVERTGGQCIIVEGVIPRRCCCASQRYQS
jgi:hypothetical protein